ncbi:hypothetical protein BDR22DRAFT_811593 [Usnea florida]
MSSNFFSLAREIRDQIYELVLLQQDPIDYRNTWWIRPQATELLRTIHREASSMFYSQNHFDLTAGTPEQLALFFTQIGKKNADFIRHVHIRFPEILCGEPDEVILDNDDVGILAKIQSSCANVTTLTFSPYSTDAMVTMIEEQFEEQKEPKVVTEAFELVNTHFRAISSLQEIIIEMHEKGPSDHIQKEMEGCGWKINMRKWKWKRTGTRIGMTERTIFIAMMMMM